MIVQVGFPNMAGLREVRVDRKLVGYIRSVGDTYSNQARYFAEGPDRFPIEGTYRTRKAALKALMGW